MKLLAPLVRRSESRMSWSEYVAQVSQFFYSGHAYPLGFQTTYSNDPAEAIDANFVGLVDNALKANGVVAAVESVRVSVFSEARFQWQRLEKGRPGDLFSTPALEILEQPYVGGTTGDLLARALLDADFAGNGYVTLLDGELVRLRPDWTDIVLQQRIVRGRQVGWTKFGFRYYEGGDRDKEGTAFLANEVAHFAPMPDPLASFRGMSWLTPVIREIQSDSQYTRHKQKFVENAATPNLAVSLPKEITPQQFDEFVELMDAKHMGVEQAYRTLYTGGGADVTVIGADMRQLDFKNTQGAGETRIAAAAGVHPVIVGLSEGLAGSSLNAGNFGQARRRFADGTLRPLWRNFAGSMQTLVPPPSGARLWYDDRDIGFLREDAKDAAEIEQTKAVTIRQLIDAGYDPDSVTAAVDSQDMSLLQHTGLFSVQLQPPGTQTPAPPVGGRSRAVRAAIEVVQRMAEESEESEERSQRAMGEMSDALQRLATREQVVNVQAPTVHVEAPTVNVEPPVVNVHPVIEPGKRTRKVVRDGQGNITKVIEE